MPSSMKSMRAGIVGAGHISEFHLQALADLDHVEIVGIADLDLESAQQRAQDFGIPNVFRAFEDLLTQNLDVVHILTPPASHAALAIQAMEHGCHVFVEKPLAESVEECDQILQVSQQTNRVVSVDHSLLRDPFTVAALQIVKEGKIGDVLSMELMRNQDLPPYVGGPLPAQYRKGGYPFRDLGIHALYQIEAFLGEIQEIDYRFKKLGRDSNLAFDDWRATVDCARGTAHVHLSWNSRPLQDIIVIQGSQGSVCIDRFGMRVLTKFTNRLPEHPQRLFNAMKESWQTALQVPWNLAKVVTKRIRRYHGLKQMVREFYSRLDQEKPQIVSLQDARRISFWVERVAGAADQQKELQAKQVVCPMQAKTLVTGGTGLIGRELVARLQASGEKIRMLVRKMPADESWVTPNIEFIVGDLGDPNVVDQAVNGIERIYHVGGVTHGDEDDFVRGNVAGTQNIIDSCVRHQVQQLVYISSLSVLYSAVFKRGKPIDETWPLEPAAELRGAYTKTKLDAEQAVMQAVQENKLPAVILRPAEVIGLGAPTLSSGVAQRVKGRLVILGNGKLEVPLINVKDLVDAILLAAKRNLTVGSIIQIVDSESKTQNELVQDYLKITGEKSSVWHVPRWFLYLAGFGLQNVFGLLGKRAPLSVYRLRSALSHRTFQSDVAANVLGWRPTRGVESGIRDAHKRSQDRQPSSGIEKPEIESNPQPV